MARNPSVFVHALALCESDDVGPHAIVEGGAVVGDGVTIKNGVLLWSGVTVEDGVFLGPGAVFANDASPRAAFPKGPAGWRATLVRHGATVGANATVLSGLTVGRFAMVGAGAGVTPPGPHPP